MEKFPERIIFFYKWEYFVSADFQNQQILVIKNKEEIMVEVFLQRLRLQAPACVPGRQQRRHCYCLVAAAVTLE